VYCFFDCSFQFVVFKNKKFQKTTANNVVSGSSILMEILFWNNDSYALGFKIIREKRCATLFPIFIIG
jgi:hypothetical protein